VSATILDASAAVAILRHEPKGPVVALEIERALRSGHEIVVPAHFWLEVANAYRSSTPLFARDTVEAIHRLETYRISTMETDRGQLLLAIEIAEREGLTPYDAAYIALARVVEGRILTLDRAMARAAGPLAIHLPGDGRVSEAPEPYLSDRERRSTLPDYSELSAFLSKLRADAIRDREAIRR